MAPAALALALAVIAEKPPEPRPLLAPTGEAIVADALGEGVNRIGARFAGGLTLAAASIESAEGPGRAPRAGGKLVLELDWIREPVVDRGMGVFVHIEPSEGEGLNGDHVELSQAVLIETAPAGKILRDLLPITLPTDAAKKQWKITVGLWRIRRGGKRVPIVDRGNAAAEDDEVLVATFDVK